MTSKDGTTEWVLKDHAAEFEQHGAKFIKEKYGVKSADPARKSAKLDAVTNALKELAKEKKKRWKMRNPLKRWM